jgi:GDP-4-dehydro-6-deoxy-D-mannose reductase
MVSAILITGCTGFVGRYVLEQCSLCYPQADVFGLVAHAVPSMQTHAVKLLVADITQRDQVQHAIAQARPDLIFHLAAQSSVADSWKNPQQTLRVNTEGTIHLLEALRAERLSPRIVLVGSGEQYGLVRPEENPIREDCPFRPANPYAAAKASQDLYGYQYFIAYDLPIIRTRPFNHFGPGQSSTFVIAKFARQLALIEAGKAAPKFPVGNLEARRDFLPVEDVVAAYMKLAEQGQPGAAYNIGSGHARSIRSMLDLLLTLTTVSIQIYEDPALLRPIDVPLLEADTSRLRTDTNWQPTIPLEAALQRTLDYWRAVVASEAS